MTCRTVRNYAGQTSAAEHLYLLRHFMKILYFSLDYTPHDQRFLSALSKTEHDVYYVRLQRGSRQTEDRPIPEKIKVVRWAGGKRAFSWLELPKMVLDFRRVATEIQPDLVHAGPIQTCAFIAALSVYKKFPILCMSWGFDLMKDVDRGAGWRFATRYTLKCSSFFTSDAFITRSKAVAFGMNPGKTVVFPWGVDLDHFQTAPRLQPVGQSSDFTIFCNRSWEVNYGVDILAKAFVITAQQRPEARMLLLAGGSQGPVIRQILEDSKVQDRVQFAGQIGQNDLPNFYRKADLYISPSHIDGSSVSLMEALACGLPCLVSDIPANKEWVTEDQNGWLFPDGNAEVLAEKIMNAIDHKRSLEQISLNARKTAETKADWSANFSKLLFAYEETVKHA